MEETRIVSTDYEQRMSQSLADVLAELRLANWVGALLIAQLDHIRSADKDPNVMETALAGARLTKLSTKLIREVLPLEQMLRGDDETPIG